LSEIYKNFRASITVVTQNRVFETVTNITEKMWSKNNGNEKCCKKSGY
jgi:hypothetical protein